jgi:hypothetical protein
MKTTGKKKPTAATNKIWKKAVALPRRSWTVGGAIVLAVVIAWLMLAPARKEAPPAPSSSWVSQTGGAPDRHPPASAAMPDAIIPQERRAFIQAVRLQPSQPTRMDSLKAKVEAAPAAPEKLVYTYLWKVNDRVIEEAVGDTLNLSSFHKRDLVAVTVTPYDGETAGFAVASPLVAIHSIPPSLELKAMRQARKTGEPIELQLVGAAPDGDQITFSLEVPHVPGMTIDQRSGKISWRLQPDQKGVFRFGAAVEDDNGTKVTKIFEITAE